MGKPLILVTSITYAMKSIDLLKKNGFLAEMKRVPKHIKHNGCSYGVYVKDSSDEAVDLLIKNKIKILGRIEAGD